ncbi:MAG: TolC family protein [Hyphomicrobiales bacterium]
MLSSRLTRALVALALALVAAAARPGAPALASPPAAGDALDSLHAAPVLDIDLLERAAIARNASLGAMREAWAGAEARADAAGALSDPMLDGMAAPRSLGNDAVMPRWEVGLSQHVPIFGQRGLERAAARAEARAEGENVGAMRLDLIRDARTLFYEIYEVARAQAVNDELRALVEQFRRVALQKYAAGTVGESDALQAEVEIAMLDHERVVLLRERRTQDARLRALLHDEGDAPFPEPPESVFRGAASPDSTRAAAVTLDVNTLPSVRAAAAMRDARAAEERLAKRANAPEFTFMVRYDRGMAEPERRVLFGVGLNVPLWRGRIDARVRAARAAVARADHEADARRDEARAALTEAIARVEESGHERHVIDEGVIPATLRSLSSARSSYEADRGDFLTLLNAERDLAKARLAQYRADANYGKAIADLDRALGTDPVGDAADAPTEESR